VDGIDLIQYREKWRPLRYTAYKLRFPYSEMNFVTG
jgi:hypothetical protein